ncbi:MAG: sulfite exporter TauE/SafE family protein [Candidatus Eremiobacteraeota bacterium]|nr:sulfite exporter TauE/SafE family protein [Candidatus Eremiobacteraeota bacterium]MBV9647038.1 sulfite exporter TauE/SafE family protein [Candidatus Eremiobacteraeota bacterium]
MTPVFLGFIIATAIGMTGVGGGTITAPLLLLVLRMKGAVAVGTALTFAAIIKFVVAPMYVIPRKVDYKIFGWMCLGGVPGVLVGGRLLITISKRVDAHTLYLILGTTVVLAAAANIYRLLKVKNLDGTGNKPRLLSLVCLPIGAEVGFSSAGSGALGTLSLLGLTKLPASSVVGTDIMFGLVISVIGSGIQILAGNYDGDVLLKLVIGGLVGCFFGAFLNLRIPSRTMRWALAIWLAALGLQIFWRGLS